MTVFEKVAFGLDPVIAGSRGPGSAAGSEERKERSYLIAALLAACLGCKKSSQVFVENLHKGGKKEKKPLLKMFFF